ncbi:Enoyl-CoA hydratase/carnithine racemase [Parafrankia irregularis]|uniref:Enoyl-CoA hydratase/carnithine racemase n=1 Tax=Parafrankia irregularis TaxID=795642 RepID=A0A0S4QW01_9ACTN|nr:enoyl-CoA hydratase/isomerase family protein [Parafrankia irregularis]CUU59793.1 Enoyl-CoA hydratase/carnithine racemase [Parafrankia irregularis]
MAAQQTVDVARPEPGLAVVTLHRPERLNALNRQMLTELRAAGEHLRADSSVGVVVLTGAGRGFCSGYDLAGAAEFAELGPDGALALQDLGNQALFALHSLPQPVIAAVRGPAVGGGFSVALAADIRLAADDALFQAAFVRIGMSGADMGASWLLPRIVGRGTAAELMYTARGVDAAEAVRIGLANRAVPAGALLPQALDLAREILVHPRTGLALTKRALQANTDAPSLWSALETEARGQALLMGHPETTAAVARLRDRLASRPVGG